MEEKHVIMDIQEKHSKLRDWVSERKELSVRKLETAASIPYSTLSHVLGPRKALLPEHHWPNLEKVLAKYGWVVETV